MRDRPDRRLSRAIAPLLFAVVVVLGSYGLVRWQHGRRTQRAHFSGAKTVLYLASYVPEAPLGVPLGVAILRDSATDGYYDGPATMDSIVDDWSRALTQLGARVRVVTPRQALAATDVRVFVVPASPCLGGEARHALDVATERGQGVLATWLTGIRDGGCRLVGYGLVTALSGASRLDTLERRSQDYVTFLRGGPLAADIPPGARLELLVSDHVAIRSPLREAFYSDFMLNPQPAQREPLVDGAIAHAEAGHGRTVYWGFDLSRVARRPWDQELALRLARNSILWAANAPLATVLPWPDGKLAAAVIAQDVEDQFANARYAVDSLRAAHFPGTYFLVSDLALRNTDLVRAMAAQGEIGTHTPKHQLLGGEAPDVQRAQLVRTQHDLESLLGHPVAGLRPPEEQFDTTTLDTWESLGGRYVFGANNARTASPEILSVDGKQLVLLGRVINDDFLSVARAGHTNARVLTDEYLSGFDKVQALGGLFILSYHSQLMSRPELVPALAAIARRLAADSTLWTATAGEVADWWLRRAHAEASATYTDPTHLRLTVANHGTQPLAHAAVRVLIGASRPVAATGATVVGADRWSVRVLLPTIPANASRVATITLAAPVRTDGPRLDGPPAPERRMALAH